AEEIKGVGFKTADDIVNRGGIKVDPEFRTRAGILYVLGENVGMGHTFLPEQEFKSQIINTIGAGEEEYSNALEGLKIEKKVICTDAGRCYLAPFYYMELGVARMLLDLDIKQRIDEKKLEAALTKQEEDLGVELDEIQRDAIKTAAGNGVMVLTGGPGTGKTTTIKAIIGYFESRGMDILLAAPTGRAAKRMKETTGRDAFTIHRMLQMKGDVEANEDSFGQKSNFERNETNPLETDVIIIDEMSMVDISLMHALLKATAQGTRLIMVGDVDQLPSVGAGNVLRDFIDSGCFPVVRLTRIFRQAQTSRIIMNAHRINSGKLPDISNGRNSDFFFMDMEKEAEKQGLDGNDYSVIAQLSADTIVRMVKTNLPRYYHTPPSEIQVLTPMQRGIVGATNLNQALQAAINPTGQGLKRGGYLFRAGDKVMQIRNNYDKEVFNGDIGIIDGIDLEERTLSVRFDDRSVEYDISELDELVLAYATTIHKSQGSEYPIVVIPVLMSHYIMLQRNLIYTGIT
ncbi:MAG: AAA family ATPase, partial [Firmicutes bacterium]|nr:AAA family ATPase [Bacillota bacterium]